MTTPMICPHCQHEIPNRAVYCGACGRRVIGWRGKTEGKGGRPAVDSNVETQPIPPDPRLLEAAGADPATTRKMAPDSHLLRIIRGETTAPRESRDDGARTPATARRAEGDDPADGAPAAASRPPEPAPPPRAAVPPQTMRDDPTQPVRPMSATGRIDTLDYAYGQGPSRLWLLLGADGVLLVVGIYLMVSWAVRPASRSAYPPAEPPGQASMGYIDWNDEGGGRIATGPVQATFAPPDAGVTPPVDAAAPASRRAVSRPPPRRRVRPMEPDPLARIRLAPPPMIDPLAETARRRALFLKKVPKRVHRQQRRIRRCYEQVLQLIRTVRGDIDIEFLVGADGRVKRARAHRNTTGSTSLESCIVGVFLSLRFPKPPGGKVTVRYPFRFAPRH